MVTGQACSRSRLTTILPILSVRALVGTVAKVTATVLIVEDDANLRDVLCATLVDEGYLVEAVADASGALDHVSRHHPTLILLDLNLPGMDGRELFVQLRAHGVPSRVIFVTGWQWAKRGAEQYGADGFIAKPFNFDDLLALVRQHISQGDCSHPPCAVMILQCQRLQSLLH